MKGLNKFSYLWKFEPDIPNRFEQNLLKTPQTLQRMYELINVFATQQFRSFWLLIFPLLLTAKSWKLHKLLKLTSSFNFWT